MLGLRDCLQQYLFQLPRLIAPGMFAWARRRAAATATVPVSNAGKAYVTVMMLFLLLFMLLHMAGLSSPYVAMFIKQQLRSCTNAAAALSCQSSATHVLSEPQQLRHPVHMGMPRCGADGPDPCVCVANEAGAGALCGLVLYTTAVWTILRTRVLQGAHSDVSVTPLTIACDPYGGQRCVLDPCMWL